MDNPYFIKGPALVSFSGGRTSGYMLWHILEAHNGNLPDDVHVVFANTGKEREETLRFVYECSHYWKVHIHWLEWTSRKGPIEQQFQEVGYNSADRHGEPFRKMVFDRKHLPQSAFRFCTQTLKLDVLRNFMLSRGYDFWLNVVGLRADEKTRVDRGKKRNQDGGEPFRSVYPMFDAGVSNTDVREFWRQQPFDLNLLPFEGNCDGCFLKNRGKLMEIERTNKGALDWWDRLERDLSDFLDKDHQCTFRKDEPYSEIIDAVRRQGDLFAGCFDDDPEMDAECGLWCDSGAP